MRWFDHVCHFVNQDVFETLLWLLGKLGIQADIVCRGIAASPSCLHALYEYVLHFHAQMRFPDHQ